MPTKHLMIAIDWYGPYSNLDEAHTAAADDYDDGLYICIGKEKYDRKDWIKYVGIGEQLHTRLKEEHHKLKLVKPKALWLGEIATAEPSGKKIKITKATLDYSEWLHARFMHLPLNEKKTKGLPPRSVTVLNRWWHKDYATPWSNRPHSDWPDLIDYPANGLPARLVWFGGRQKRFLAPAYAEP